VIPRVAALGVTSRYRCFELQCDRFAGPALGAWLYSVPKECALVLKESPLEALQRVIENPGKVGLARTAEIIAEIPLQSLIYYLIITITNDR
jgi:hypothetical protein